VVPLSPEGLQTGKMSNYVEDLEGMTDVIPSGSNSVVDAKTGANTVNEK
jgi:hypothetical protein